MNNLLHILADISLSSAVLSLFICFLLSYIYIEKKDSTEFFLTVTLMSSTVAALVTYIALSSLIWKIVPEKLVLLYHTSIAFLFHKLFKVIETKFEHNDSILKVCRHLFGLVFLVLISSLISEMLTGYNPVLCEKPFDSHSIILGKLSFDSSPTWFGELLAIIFSNCICFLGKNYRY